jgi:hypothetical protein
MSPSSNERSARVVRVDVDDAPWERVESLAASGPVDRHYVVATDAAGRTTIEFGDGRSGKRPPDGASVRVRYATPGSRFMEVRLQTGRVTLDADLQEPARERSYFGLYRAVVINALDPAQAGRILVRLRGIEGAEAVWADVCRPSVADNVAPEAGDVVWILFEEGDRERPVWIGRA